MRKTSDRIYWLTNDNWYKINKEKDCFELTKEAPEKAVISFQLRNSNENENKYFQLILKKIKRRLK